MKKTIFLIAAGICAAGCFGLLAKCYNDIQQKNTRLAFYEILTESKNINYNTVEQMSSWLVNLKELETRHLKQCEQIQYHNKSAYFKRRVKQIDMGPSINLSVLRKVARKYYGETPTLERLSQLGETEFKAVLSEIDVFEDELKTSDYDGTLIELTSQSKNFSSSPKEVEQIYNRFISKSKQTISSRFYPYDIAKVTVKVTENPHEWSAYAQYDPYGNTMTAFFDVVRYDTTIAAFISVHEVFPGHQLDAKAAISNPLCPGDNLSSLNWLAEGWATYAEFVANEEGFFDQPEHKLAWLDYRLIRAMRIILDVKRMEGVTEYEALQQIWEQRMPMRLTKSFDREFNRLEKSFHQHLSYIIGYKAIFDAKTKLVQEFGAEFDGKKFHDVILRLDHKEPAAFYETVKIGMKIPSDDQYFVGIQTKN